MNQVKFTAFLKSQKQPVACVLGGGTNGLGLIRSLGRRKIPTVYLNPSSHHLNFFSKYCWGLQCPSPLTDENAFIEFIMAIGRTLDIKPVLIPAADPYVLAVSKHKKVVEESFQVPFSDYSVIDMVVRKKRFYSLLDTMSIDHPITYSPTTPEELDAIGDQITYPCIVKPSFSFPFSDEFGCKLFEVMNKNSLIQCYTKTSSAGYEMIIQDRIPGGDSTVFQAMGYLNKQSVPLGIFTFQKLRQYPLDYGSGSLNKGIWMPDIAHASIDFLQRINYHGAFGAEYKWDERDGKYKFIEVNARLPWQNSLAARSGVDLTDILYRDAVGDPYRSTSQKDGVKWISMSYDLAASCNAILRGNLSLSEWAMSIKGEREYAVFTTDDPIPFIVYILRIGMNFPHKAWGLIKSYAGRPPF